MVTNNLIENSRLEVQKNLDNTRLHEARRKLGQFATPYPIAMEMLQYASTILHQSEISFLDPAFGTGVFYSACLDIFSVDRIRKAVGYEIDKMYWKAAINLWNHEQPLHLINDDFTRTPSPKTEKERFNLIICNPPYVRHHAMTSEEKKRLGYLAVTTVGIRPSGYSGLYCYFLLLSHFWMSKGGIAGWLIPSEFMDVNYGKQIKEYLLSKVTLLHIHRFNPLEAQFNDALVSSAVVWFRNDTPPPNHNITFSYGGTLLKPSVSRFITANTLKDALKWSGFPTNSYKPIQNQCLKTLGDFFAIKRGIATGANDFFVLPQEKAEKLELPKQFLKPVLPPPRCLKVKIIDSDQVGNPIIDQRLVLLSCNLQESIVKKEYPTLWHYLLHGKEQKINERYICKHRSPWYSQEKRPTAPFLFNIIGRPDYSKRKGYRFILNKSQATATNNYLMLYPKPPFQELLNRETKLLDETWIALNSIPLSDLLREGRVYGGGLYKIEPKELMRVCSNEFNKFLLHHQKQFPIL